MPSELDLIRQFCADRNEDSFRLVYHQFTPIVYRYALRMLSDRSQAIEATQETWVRAVKGIETYQERSSFGTWLTGICINCCREMLRQRNRWNEPETENTDFFPPVENNIALIDLEAALKKLPSGYREVLLLHDMEGFKHHEIADLLGIKEGTSKSQLFHARRVMRKFLSE